MLVPAKNNPRPAGLSPGAHTKCTLSAGAPETRPDYRCADGKAHRASEARADLPRRPHVYRIICQELLIVAPLRHVVVVRGWRCPGLPCGRGVLHPVSVPAHFLLRGHEVLAEVRWLHLHHAARLVRERALTWEDVVEPLREEPPVEGDVTAHHAGELMQLGLERLAHGHKLVWLRW